MLNKKISEKLNVDNPMLHPPFPKKNLLIEITNACNNKCVFCANRVMTRKLGMIDPQLLYRVLHDAFDLGEREVGFYATGEPLLNKNIYTYIKKAKEVGYEYIYITTNGILANLDNVKKLYGSGLNSIKFSINGIDETDYKFACGSDNFSKVMENLIAVYNWKKQFNIPMNIFVSCIITKYTKQSKEKIKSFFDNYCDESSIQEVKNQGGMLPEIDKELLCNDVDSAYKINLPCNYPFNSVVVSYEGYLTSCCMDFQNYLAYADLNYCTLKDAWDNDKIVELRMKHICSNVNSTLCEGCVNNKLTNIKPLDDVLYSPMNIELINNDSYIKEKIKECYGREK